jgi:uncharacterized protein YaeQ
MATGATIFKAELQIADLDRNYYQDHALTLARHPSETDERMMVRLLAFALHAHEELSFGNGLSTCEEPDLWQRDLTGAVQFWIDVGLPDERLVRKACGRADQTFIYTYGGRVAEMWWNQCCRKLEQIRNLAVINLPPEASRAIAKQARRNMHLNCTIQDGQIWVADENESVFMELVTLKSMPLV